MGQECCISRRRARLYSGGIHAKEVQGDSHSFTAGAAPRVKAAKSSEFGEGEL